MQAPGASPNENEAQRGRGCVFVAFILFFLLSPCPRARTVSALINVCFHIHMHTVPILWPARVHPPHTHWAWTPIVNLLCVTHSPSATIPYPFHTKLPVGKTHNFYTTQS